MRSRSPHPASLQPPADLSAGAWRAVLLPSVFLLVAMFNLTLVVAGLKEFILDDLGGTVAHATLFFSVETFAYILFAPLWGLLSDRTGRRKPFIVFGFLASAAIYLGYGWVHDIQLLLVLRFIQGGLSVMGWSTIMALVLDLPDEGRRGRHMGLMGAALIFGVALGAPVGGYITRAYGARAPLDVAALFFFAIALGSLFLVETRGRRRQASLGELGATLYRQPRLLLPMTFHFIDRFTVGIFVVIFPIYLSQLGAEGADPAVRGRYLGYFLFPFALLQYLTGKLSERIGPYRPLIVGSLLYGVVLTSVGYSGLAALRPVMITLGTLAAVMFPPTLILTARFSEPSTRGTAVGGFNLAGSLGFAIGPLFGAWSYQHHGFSSAFVLSGVLEITASLVALWWVARWSKERGNGV